MPAPIHAVLVVRADSRPNVLEHFSETLDAVRAQTLPVDALTVVLCGSSSALDAVVASSGAEGVITAPSYTGYAAAVRLAARRVAPGFALWLLAQDTAPRPDALQHLAAKLETSLTVAVVAPKLVRAAEPTILESAGVTMTQFGRSITFGRGQIDQGQLDDTQDILGSDIRGILIRADEAQQLLPDTALAGGDEGLDIGVRARVREHRVDLAPAAIVEVHGDGVAGLPAPRRARDRRRISYVNRVAQLHRRLVYAPAWAIGLHILSFPFLALWRSLQHLLNKHPARVVPEWGAHAIVAFRWGAIARSRRALGGTYAGFKRVAPLRLTRRQVKAVERQMSIEESASQKSDLRFFSGGGAWITLGALVLSVGLFPSLLAWPTIAGGALLPLRETVTQLWADTAYGYAGTGLDPMVPSDPFTVVIALLGSLWPTNPATVLVALWVFALPLAVLGGWFATTRVTERSGLRIAGAIAWALAPTFWSALVDPRPTAVLAHLLLPWFAYTVLIAHRSWGAAASASLVLAAIAACSPSLGAILLALSAVAAVVFASWGRLRAAGRYLWILLPTLVWFAPLAWRRFSDDTPLALLVDPGLAFAGDRADDSAVGRLLTSAGFIDADPGRWGSFLDIFGLASAAPLATILVVPVVLSAVCAPFLKRWLIGTALLATAAVAIIGSLLASRIELSFADGSPVAIWPGALLSLAWLALVLAALVVWNGARLPRATLSAFAVVSTLLVAVSAVPMLTAHARGDAGLVQGSATTLPAFIAAEARESSDIATLVLMPRADSSFAARIVWGGSDTLGSQSTLVATRTAETDSDRAVADQVAAIATPGARLEADDLAALGVRYVLVALTTDGSQANAAREAAMASLSVHDGFTRVGETGKGALWRIDTDPAPRPAATADEASLRRVILLSGAAVTLIALLLAVPTPTSVRASRRKPRIVDARGAEQS